MKNKGGTAFPTASVQGRAGMGSIMKPNGNGGLYSYMDMGEAGTPGLPGMNLRDYFAAKSMQGYRSCESTISASSDDVARWAYIDADAMIAESSKE